MPGPEQRGKISARETRRIEANQAEKRKTWTRRGIVGVGLSAGVGVGVKLLLPHSENQDRIETFYPLTEKEARLAFVNMVPGYNKALKTDVDPEELQKQLSYVKHREAMSQADWDKICSDKPCGDAAMYTSTHENRIYIMSGNLDLALSTRRLTHKERRDALLLSAAHELSHLLGSKTTEYSPDFDELREPMAEMLQKQMPGVTADQLSYYNNGYGATIDFRIGNTDTKVKAFGLLEEIEAETLAHFYARESGVSTESGTWDTRISAQSLELNNDMLGRMGDLDSMTIQLSNYRQDPLGRYAYLRQIGDTFGSGQESPIALGFQILRSIESGNSDLYHSLTSGGQVSS